ncbi:MAG: thiamine diphosphokinase [Clostridiales bacterium]|nr:thiamine diphosphokinase [Clostridiales bacterium]
MRCCYAFGAGELFFCPPLPSEGDLVIAADGGYRHLADLGIKPDLVIGDFDSSICPGQGDWELVVLPAEKDQTDMAAAVQIGYDRGYRLFRLFGGTGGRVDHTAANVQLLAWLARRNARGFLHFQNQVAFALKDGEICFDASQKGYISVFAYSGDAVGVTLEGLKYPLDNYTLHDDVSLGVSNEFTGKPSRISVRKGLVMIVKEK